MEEEKVTFPFYAGHQRGLDIDDIIDLDEEKTAGHKVRVKHLYQKLIKEINLIWLGDVVDPRVDNMIRDLLDGTLDKSFWDRSLPVSPEKKCSKSKADENSELRKAKQTKLKKSTEKEAMKNESSKKKRIREELKSVRKIRKELI